MNSAAEIKKTITIRGREFIIHEPTYYKCHCQTCDIDFFVHEDWPYHVQQPEEEWLEDLPDLKDYHGLTVFEVYCPRCGQKLMFSVDDTPFGHLEWHELKPIIPKEVIARDENKKETQRPAKD